MIQEFLTYQLENKGLSAQTVEGYSKDIRSFIRYALPQGLTWSTLTAEDMDRYVRYEVIRGMQPRTIKRRVEVIRLVLTWANHKGLLSTNAAQYTQTPKPREELPRAANADNLRHYLSSPTLSRESVIMHIWVAVMLETGLRAGEMLNLKGEDIDMKKQTIRVQGKGAKERIVWFGSESAKWLKLVACHKGVIFTENSVTYRYMMYKEVGKFCPRVHPHAIRHAFACEQLEKGMDLKSLSILMGHKHQETTEIYAHMTNSHAGAIYQQLNK